MLVPLVLLLLTNSQKAVGQNHRWDINKSILKPSPGIIHLPAYDDKFMHYGFYVAFNNGGFNVDHSSQFNLQLFDTTINSITKVSGQRTIGFNLGFIFNMRLTEYFDLRGLPGVGFYQRPVMFTFQNDSTVTQLSDVTFSYFELPVMLKLKSERRKNFRAYVIAGINPMIEVGPVLEELDIKSLRASTIDFAVEYGIGVDIFYPMFKFSPEIRFSHSLVNLHHKDPNIYSRAIQRMTAHSIKFIINFE